MSIFGLGEKDRGTISRDMAGDFTFTSPNNVDHLSVEISREVPGAGGSLPQIPVPEICGDG